MNMTNQEYDKLVRSKAKKSPIWKDMLWAFLVGGAICAGGQGLSSLYQSWGLSQEQAGTVTSVTLIFLAALLSGVGVFDKIAKYAGAGTLVPITGFANAVVSPAIDSHAEGLILGVGAKIFTVAGPVLLYGTLAGGIWGVVWWIVRMLI